VLDVACGKQMVLVLGSHEVVPSAVDNSDDPKPSVRDLALVDGKAGSNAPKAAPVEAGKADQRERLLGKLLSDAAIHDYQVVLGFNQFQAVQPNSRLEKFVFSSIPHRRRAEMYEQHVMFCVVGPTAV